MILANKNKKNKKMASVRDNSNGHFSNKLTNSQVNEYVYDSCSHTL